jgi:hypothetical protein
MWASLRHSWLGRLVGKNLEDKVITDDIFAQSRSRLLRSGLATCLPPFLTRFTEDPVVRSLAYGSSIPHIDIADVLSYEVVLLGAREEQAIADLAESSAKAGPSADILEREITNDASAVIDRFIAGDLVGAPVSKP